NNLFLVLNELTFCLIASYLVFKDRIATVLVTVLLTGSLAVLIYTNKNKNRSQQLFSFFLNFF
ncbi:MAG: hypothetical protein IK151_07815, partial [Erysipelotrichaceae bacterium]|nr:hypothetical protein [Erysipelotrichaceae bacterium]